MSPVGPGASFAQGMFSDWRARAACVNAVEKDSRFLSAFSEKGDARARLAKSICVSVCPVREECLFSAVKENDATGIRGGFFFEGGRVLRTQARQILDEFGQVVPTSLKEKKAMIECEESTLGVSTGT